MLESPLIPPLFRSMTNIVTWMLPCGKNLVCSPTKVISCLFADVMNPGRMAALVEAGNFSHAPRLQHVVRIGTEH